jgi:L-aminopeptidase/D-esterase-like protein
MKTSLTILISLLFSISGVSAWADAPSGPYNAITDVAGIEVGHYAEKPFLTGTTVILARQGAVGAADVRGSAPGTRETDLLNPINLVEKVHAIVLSGGSAYGLATADGVTQCLEEQGIGFPVGGGHVVPIVPAAILYDLGRCGTDFKKRPDAKYGLSACKAAARGPVAQGNVGAGTGARAGGLKGGIGTASIDLGNGVMVGAIIAVNSFGSTVNLQTGKLYGAFLEIGNEFGILQRPKSSLNKSQHMIAWNESDFVKNTTIAIVATNVELTKAQALKIAQMAHDGMARAIRPVHTMFDGDTIFALSTGQIKLQTLPDQATWGNIPASINRIGSAAADTVSRAIVHAMLAAKTIPDCLTSYCDKYPGACPNRKD